MSPIQKERWSAVGAYILFFLPLVAGCGSRFSRFHCNQGLVLLLIYLAVSTIGRIIPFIGQYVLLPLANIGWCVLALIGMYNAWLGRQRRLPLIGRIILIREQ